MTQCLNLHRALFRTSWGTKIVHEKFTLTEEDRKFLALKPTEEIPKILDLDCSGYAFLKVKEVNAISWIKSVKRPIDFYNSDPFKFLSEWGYRTVSAPNEGDLVVYMLSKDGTEPPRIKHIGVMTASGLVESKMAFNEVSICQHKLEDVPGQYGNLILFFRKRPYMGE